MQDKILPSLIKIKQKLSAFIDIVTAFINKYKKYFYNFSSFKSTITTILIYIFLFYLPFTISTFLFDRVVFFQLDHLYQFSTMVFDFRNRIFDLNFSTWDYKNTLGYDYFANFYYIPLDISLLPFFVLPFLSATKLLWLSFLLKILIGTFLFGYLLKLYKFKHSTIFIATIIYGTSDLFFAQNVFPTYTGLIMYIPLVLIAVELLLTKKRYIFFSLVIFQLFLFSYYWAWPLSLFMMFALILRYFILSYNPEHKHIRELFKMMGVLFKSFLFYLLGLGLASFFILPVIGVMLNEPRMEGAFKLTLDGSLFFNTQVYLKVLFKMIIPNLYNYSGYFYDKSLSYFLPTNHVIVYSSIFSTFTIVQFLFILPKTIKQKLSIKDQKGFYHLRNLTFGTLLLMSIPLVSSVFSASELPYLRWFVFFGTLLIINFAWLFEKKLINTTLLASFLTVSVGYLIYSIQYNSKMTISSSFLNTEKNIATTFIVMYASFVLVWFISMFFHKKYPIGLILLAERSVAIGLILSIMVSTYFSHLVNNYFNFGDELNQYYRENQEGGEYNYRIDMSFNKYNDVRPVQNISYINSNSIYNNNNIFHSLINPYYGYIRTNTTHRRSYNAIELPYFYYLYLDPNVFTVSNSTISPFTNYFYPPDSELKGHFEVDNNMYYELYESPKTLSIGSGFTTIYDWSNSPKFPYMWLNALYINDEAHYQELLEMGFKESTYSINNMKTPVSYDSHSMRDYKFDDYLFSNYQVKQIEADVTREDSDVLVINSPYIVQAALVKDNKGDLFRCYRNFCYIPEAGIDKVYLAFNKTTKITPTSINFYGSNTEVVNKQIEKLVKYSTYDVVMDDSTITSKVTNDVPILMNYRVGYAKGWSVTVDGKSVETFPAHGGLLSFIVTEPGDHDIVMVYKTPLLKEGVYISLGSTLFLATLIGYHSYKKKRNESPYEETN